MISRSWRCPGEGKGYPLQYSGLENFMDCIVHAVTKSWTWTSDFHFLSLYVYKQAEKEQKKVSRWLDKPNHINQRRQWHPTPVLLPGKSHGRRSLGRLQSMGSLRVRHVTSLSLFTFMNWRRKWQPTPVFLPGEFQGRGSLVGCRLWGRTESDTIEAT